MSNIIHLNHSLSNADFHFENHPTASRIIFNLSQIEKLNKNVFSDIDTYLAGLLQGLNYKQQSNTTQGSDSFKEKLKQALLENA